MLVPAVVAVVDTVSSTAPGRPRVSASDGELERESGRAAAPCEKRRNSSRLGGEGKRQQCRERLIAKALAILQEAAAARQRLLSSSGG
jgi:hypothetical protein